ncbi:putative oxalocrotonate tautomerase [Dactylonectria macrodidyma]|uniref:Oxalocrotonate tautomerase n=1 Tax=Dactylonectria macrodidyma TaxID=307937 RepID=A0A9P9FL18_9HYPO|nr:putative oxalocrotonate tautomerase [Dactylonectria macrodidyma]
MPKWVFHHSKGSFTREDKEKLAKGMSNIYTTFGLPAFFAHVHFIELTEDEMWTGGKPSPLSATISIYHAAANIRSVGEGEEFQKALDDVVRPVLKPKNIRWESNVYETPREWWRLQGMAPPDFNTDMLKKWVKDNTFTDEDEEQLLRQQGYFRKLTIAITSYVSPCAK